MYIYHMYVCTYICVCPYMYKYVWCVCVHLHIGIWIDIHPCVYVCVCSVVSSVHGIFQARILEWGITPGNVPNTGMEPISLASPALADGFFTTIPPEKPIYPYIIIIYLKIYVCIYIYILVCICIQNFLILCIVSLNSTTTCRPRKTFD